MVCEAGGGVRVAPTRRPGPGLCLSLPVSRWRRRAQALAASNRDATHSGGSHETALALPASFRSVFLSISKRAFGDRPGGRPAGTPASLAGEAAARKAGSAPRTGPAATAGSAAPASAAATADFAAASTGTATASTSLATAAPTGSTAASTAFAAATAAAPPAAPERPACRRSGTRAAGAGPGRTR